MNLQLHKSSYAILAQKYKKKPSKQICFKNNKIINELQNTTLFIMKAKEKRTFGC